MVKLSVVISAYNEEKKIEDCLKAVNDLADEIIFVDNSSIDKTVSIAKKYTSKIYKRENNLMLNINKNFGFTKATGDWILSLDADERVTPLLSDEIKYQISKIKDEKIDGYYIPRKNIIFGKWIKHTGWYPDYQLRLFKKGMGKFEEKHVHEMIKLDGKVEHLKEHIDHFNYENISQFLSKTFFIYAPNEANNLIEKGYEFDWKDSIRFPVKEFLNRFFAGAGYKDGFHGLILSILMAFYHFIVFINIWEKRNYEEIDDDVIIKETENEFKKAFKDISFWYSNEKIKNIKNPLSKLTYRLIRKSRLIA